MGRYYYILNDTKRHRVHLDSHVKYGPMKRNNAVHFAIVSYLMENMKDKIRMVSDAGMDEEYEYEDVNLLEYEFGDKEVTPQIVQMLNTIYKKDIYAVVDGKGEQVELRE